MEQPKAYVCPYCGSFHDEPNAACCSEVNHCEPRWAWVDEDSGGLRLMLDDLRDKLRAIEYKDFHTQADRDVIRMWREEERKMLTELAMRDGSVYSL